MLPILFEHPKTILLKFVIYNYQQKLNLAKKTLNNQQKKHEAFQREYYLQLNDLIDSVNKLRQESDSLETLQHPLPSKENQRYLKKIYLKACKLSHPDYLKPEALANQIFSQLSLAYQNYDILLVESILFALQHREYQGQPSYLLKTENVVQQKLNLVQKQLHQIEDKINQLYTQYEVNIFDPENWSEQIYTLQISLEDELAALRQKSNPQV